MTTAHRDAIRPLPTASSVACPRRAQWARAAAAAALLLLVGGCMYRTGLNELPGLRSFGWYSYASAQDIRTRCTPGHDTYRVIYNGPWAEQVRTYDFGPSATGSGGVVDQRVFAGGAGFTIATRLEIPLGDPVAPARAVDAQTRLSDADYRALVAALVADGLGQAAPARARLESWQFWWAAAACVDGRFHYNAWIWPSSRFAALRFPDLLLRHDQTGVPITTPRRTASQSTVGRDNGRDPFQSDFTIQLDGDGLPIRLPAF